MAYGSSINIKNLKYTISRYKLYEKIQNEIIVYLFFALVRERVNPHDKS